MSIEVGSPVQGTSIVPSTGTATESTYAASAALGLKIEGYYSSNRLAFASAKAEITDDKSPASVAPAAGLSFKALAR